MTQGVALSHDSSGLFGWMTDSVTTSDFDLAGVGPWGGARGGGWSARGGGGERRGVRRRGGGLGLPAHV